MSFLAPLYLLSLAALGLPVWLHLRSRRPTGRRTFSTLRFLNEDIPPVKRSRWPEQWLLLALRMAIIACIVMAFARPWMTLWDSAAANSNGTAWCVVVDTSASMRREGISESVTQAVEELIARLGPDDQLCVLAFDQTVREVLTDEQWQRTPWEARAALLRRCVAEAEPGWKSTQLGDALQVACERLLQSDRRQSIASRRMLLISDLQEGSQLQSLQSFQWPKSVQLEISPAHPAVPGNANLQIVEAAEEASGVRRLYARIHNSPDADQQEFQLVADGIEPTTVPLQLTVAPGETRLIPLPVDWDPAAELSVNLVGDQAAFDNQFSRAAQRVHPATVLYLGAAGADRESPEYFLRRAFAGNDQFQTTVLMHTAEAPAIHASHGEIALVVVGPEAQRDPRTPDVIAAVGATTVLIPVSHLADAEVVGRVAGLTDLQLQERTSDAFVSVDQVDLKHELLQPFAMHRFADFSSFRARRYRSLSFGSAASDVAVIARFESGDPALVACTTNQQTTYLLATSWTRSDSQIALSKKFAPLLNSMLKQQWTRIHAGRHLPQQITMTAASLAGLAVQPAKAESEIQLVSELRSEPQPSGRLTPGLLDVTAPDNGLEELRIGVNVDEAEGRTAPLSLEAFDELDISIDQPGNSPATAGADTVVEEQSRLELWRWWFMAALALIVCESLLARFRSRSALQRGDS